MSYFTEMYQKKDLDFIIKDIALQIIENDNLYENPPLSKQSLLENIHQELTSIITIDDIGLLKNKLTISPQIESNTTIEKIVLVDKLGDLETKIYQQIQHMIA